MYGTVDDFRDFILASTDYSDPQEVTDDTITAVLGYATAAVDTYVGRTLSQATLTEYYSGNGQPYLLLKRWPVTSITSINVSSVGYFGYGSDPFPSTSLLTEGTDYVLVRDDNANSWSKSGRVVYLGGPSGQWSLSHRGIPGVITPGMARSGWPAGIGNIKIVYVGGYATIPDDVIEATYLLAQTLLAQSQNNQFQPISESAGPYSVSKAQLTYYAREVRGFREALKRYREQAF